AWTGWRPRVRQQRGRGGGRTALRLRRATWSLGTASVGLDRAETVRAVDGLVHARLERDLGLVAAGRADRGEVFARQPVVPSLIASGTAEGARIRARVLRRPPVGSAAGAALRVRREPLGCVVLL